MSSNTIVIFLVFAIMPIILTLFQRFYSTRQIQDDREHNAEELIAKFKKWDIFNTLFGLVLMVACVFIWYQVLFLLNNQYNNPMLTVSKFFVPPSIGIWVITALFLGIACATVLSFMFMAFLLGAEFPSYIRFYNLKYGFDAYYLLKPMLIFVSGVGLLVTLLGFNMYSNFADSEIVLGRFGFGTLRYAYTDVLKVKYVMKFKAPNGDIKDKPYVVIDFNDGRKWNSRNRGYPSIYKNEALGEFVAKQSNRVFERIEFDQ